MGAVKSRANAPITRSSTYFRVRLRGLGAGRPAPCDAPGVWVRVMAIPALSSIFVRRGVRRPSPPHAIPARDASVCSRAMRQFAPAAILVAMAFAPAAQAGPAPLTATNIRIANHPGFIRVVVDFTGGACAGRRGGGHRSEPVPRRLRSACRSPGRASRRRPRQSRNMASSRASARAAVRITISLSGGRPPVQVRGLLRAPLAGAARARPLQVAAAERGRRDHARTRPLPDAGEHTVGQPSRDGVRPGARPVRALVRRRTAPPRRPDPQAARHHGVRPALEHDVPLPADRPADGHPGGGLDLGQGRHAGLPRADAREDGRYPPPPARADGPDRPGRPALRRAGTELPRAA